MLSENYLVSEADSEPYEHLAFSMLTNSATNGDW
jgi:hypothetical protein